MTPIELLKEIEAWLCFNTTPNVENTTALRTSIKECLEKYDYGKSDFQVMEEMCAKGMDIRMSPYFVEAKLAKGGGHVTMGVDQKTINDLVFGDDWAIGIYIMNGSQFKQIKNGNQ